MTSRLLLAAVSLSLLAAACGDDSTTDAAVTTSPPTEPAPTTAATATTAAATPTTAAPTTLPARPSLRLDLPGLPELGGVATYEAWVVVGGEPSSVGTFDLVDGALVDAGTRQPIEGLELGDAGVIESIVVTIETDDDPAPSSSHVLAGPVVDGTAALTVGDAAAIGHDFADAAGDYILATPTNGDGTDERSGIWWTFIPRSQSLFLPDLPTGWTYEGWQVIEGVPVTTGTFTELFGAPDDAAPYSGPEPGPPLVGEDFIVAAPEGLTFPTDLRGSDVVITVEPVPDVSDDPFPLVPLSGAVPADAVDHVAYPVDNVAADLPVGTATIG